MAVPRTDRARRAGAALALLALGMAAPIPDAEDVPLDAIAPVIQSTTSVVRTGRGLELDVAGSVLVGVPITGIATLELDCEVDGDLLLRWMMSTGLDQPPLRYRALRSGPVRLRLDLLQTARWAPEGAPVLRLEGSGHLAITAIRVRMAPQESVALNAAVDRALFWAPESIGPTTINTLTRAPWSSASRTALEEVLAAAGAVLLALLVAAGWVLRRRLAIGWALGVVALLCAGAANAHFLFRFLPAARLALEPDPEARIARNYYLSPELGALAALARVKLPRSDRVVVIGEAGDWFGPPALCFNLAPRRCAFGPTAAGRLAGISGVGTLRLEDADAVISYRATEALPAGFVPVASMGTTAVVARRP